MKILFVAFVVSVSASIGFAQNSSADTAKRVKINGNSLEVVSVTETAEQCKDGKGITVRLKVIGTSAVDAIRYVRQKNMWAPSQFLNKAVGDEIIDHHCYSGAVFIFYTRPAGSTEPFPKP